MTNSFLEDSFADVESGNLEQELLSNTIIDDRNNEFTITEVMIQQACASLDHDSELTLNLNAEARR